MTKLVTGFFCPADKARQIGRQEGICLLNDINHSPFTITIDNARS
ncbi:MAG TPA: hypothetical protein VH396_13195 [Chitinophagaceae bacterium]